MRKPELSDEVLAAPEDIKEWLSVNATRFLGDEKSSNAILGALPDAIRLPELIPEVMGRFAVMAVGDSGRPSTPTASALKR